jgi:hypothetical protein
VSKSHALLAFLLTTLSTGELSAELFASLIGFRLGGVKVFGEGAGARNVSSEGKLCFLPGGLPLFLGDGVRLLEVSRAAEDAGVSTVVLDADKLLAGVPTALLPALLTVEDLEDLPLPLFLYIMRRAGRVIPAEMQSHMF